MSTKPNLDNRLSELARLDHIETTALPILIARAVQLMTDYSSPLATNTNNGLGNGDSDADPSIDDRARRDLRELTRHLLIRERELRGIIRIVNEWAPIPTKTKAGDTENAAIWCENCAKYGRAEPRRGDGSRLCRWCGDVRRNYGKLPNAALQLLRDRHPRISDNDYRRLLGKAPSKKTA